MTIRTLLTALFFCSPSAFAQFDGSDFHQALNLKKNVYIEEGTITGGDGAADLFIVKTIRSAKNPQGYDRVVIDLEGVKRPPFYMIEASAKKTVVTLFGKPKLDYSLHAAQRAAQKTQNISRLDLSPLVNQDRWSWAIETKSPVKTEVFELVSPARLIIDLKN